MLFRFVFVVSLISVICFTLLGNKSLPLRYCVFNLWFAWCCGAFITDKKMLNPEDLKKPIYIFYYVIIFVIFIGFLVLPNNLTIVKKQFNILVWTAPMLLVLSKEDWLVKRRDLWIIKLVLAIGISSYSLYLLHEPLIALKNFAVHEYLPSRLQFGGVLFGFLIIPLITWFNYLYIEKPFTHRKKRVEETRS